MSERDICERCGKPKATEADCEEAERLGDSTAFDLQFCWSDWVYEECKDTRLERTQAKLTRLRDAAKAMSEWYRGNQDDETLERTVFRLEEAIAESERP